MNLLIRTVWAFYWFDEDPPARSRNSKILVKKGLCDMLRNVEIVGVANVVSLSFSEVLLAVFLHLDPGQGPRTNPATLGFT